MTTGLIGHGRRRTGEARHKAPSVWLSPTSRPKTTGTMGCCWTPRTFSCDKHAPSRSTGDGRASRTSLADVLEPFSASRLAGGHGKEPSPLAGLAAAEIPWPFAPKHTVPVMAANPHTTAHTFLARILAPWAEALSPVPLRNSSKSRRRLSSDKRRWSSHCALVHSPRSSQAATCILVLRFSKADQVALRTNHNRSSPPSLLGFGIGIQLRAKGTLRGGACTYTVESISAFCHDRRLSGVVVRCATNPGLGRAYRASRPPSGGG